MKQEFSDFIKKEMNREPQKGGFFPLPNFPDKKKEDTRCNDHGHEPPKYLHIPQGQGYTHICPSCGKRTTIIPPQVSL